MPLQSLVPDWIGCAELTVSQQVRNVASDIFVLDAWARGQKLSVHGWIYSITNGLLRDLDVTVSRPEEL